MKISGYDLVNRATATFILKISSNGLISFGHRYLHHDASLFPNEDDTSAFLVAPYWGDIDNRHLGEIWYETHISGGSAISDSMLVNVSNLVRSEQSLSSFQGALMIVATWNGSVPYDGTGALVRLKKIFFSLSDFAYSSLILVTQ